MELLGISEETTSFDRLSLLLKISPLNAQTDLGTGFQEA